MQATPAAFPDPHHAEEGLEANEKLGTDSIGVQEVEAPAYEVDEEYLAFPRWKRIYRGVTWQIWMFGCLAFVDPAMTDAITLLGGGGLSDPYLANLATSLNYVSTCLMALFGGPLINKIGIKTSCLISAVFYVLAGTGYYVMARYKVAAYLIVSKVIGGFTNAFLYVAESTVMLTYPLPSERGKYLGIWTGMRNSGQIIGGSINFATNHTNSSSGGIAWSTYLVFIGFEASGSIFALLLTTTSKVRHSDGRPVPISPMVSWRKEFHALWLHLLNKRQWLMFMPALYSFYYGGTYNTYLALHFSVRSRALNSLITPIFTVTTVLLYGLLLDCKYWSVKKRGWICFLVWLIPQIGCFIWTGVLYGQWGQSAAAYHPFDFVNDKGSWAVAYLPYFIIYTSGYWCQMNLYWMLGAFSTDVKAGARTSGLFRAFEAAGSAITYAVNSKVGDKRIPLIINCVILLLTLPCMVGLIRLLPDAPSETDDVVDERLK